MTKLTDPAGGPVKLAPSDLTFLWEECQRCFWLKVNGILKRPSGPFPKIFTKLDQQTKDYFFNRPTQLLSPNLPPGKVALGDRWVRSAPLTVPGHETAVVIAGRIDTALAFDDGSFGIIDFKTSDPKNDHIPFYGRQLLSYALAAENPAEGALSLRPITRLGLLCVQPLAMVGLKQGIAYKGETHFLEIERDDDAFYTFLSQVLFLLAQSTPPKAAKGCRYCSYLATGSLMLMTGV